MSWADEGWAEAAREYHANGRGRAPKLAAIAPRRFQLVPFNDLNPGTGPAYLVKASFRAWASSRCGDRQSVASRSGLSTWLCTAH
jgi:hypothetical protein